MNPLLEPKLLVFIFGAFIASLLNAWGVISKGTHSGYLSLVGISIFIIVIIEAYFDGGWSLSVTIILIAFFFLVPVSGYIIGMIWVRTHPRAFLLTARLANHLSGPPWIARSDIKYKKRRAKSNKVLGEVIGNPDAGQMMAGFGIPLTEIEVIRDILWTHCGPKTADIVISESNLLIAYLNCLIQHDRNHGDAVMQFMQYLDYPKV